MDHDMTEPAVVAFMRVAVADLALEEMEARAASCDAVTIPAEILCELIRLAKLGQSLEREEPIH